MRPAVYRCIGHQGLVLKVCTVLITHTWLTAGSGTTVLKVRLQCSRQGSTYRLKRVVSRGLYSSAWMSK